MTSGRVKRQAVLGIALALAIVSPGRADAAYSASVGSYSLSSSTTLSAPLVVTNGSSATYVLFAHNWSTFKTSLLVGLPGSNPATLDLGALEVGSAFDAAMTTDGKIVVAYERRSYTPARLYVAVASNGSFGAPTRIDVSAGSAASAPRVVAVGSGGAIATFVQAESGSQTLFSAEYRQGAWLSTATVADLGTAGTIAASAIDLAAGGGAAIAVFPKAVATTVTLTGSGTTTLRAHAARWNGSWGAATQIDGAAGAGALAGAAVAMSSAGDGVAAVRLAIGSTSTVVAARYASGWTGAALVVTGDILGAPRVGVATNGNAQLAFLETTLGHTILRAVRWDGATWSAPMAIDGPDDTSAFDLTVAADGVAWVVYRGSSFYVNRFDGASWEGYEYVYVGTSAGTPSAVISGTNGLLAAWSAGSTMRVAIAGVAAPAATDAGAGGDATAAGYGGGSGGGAGAAAPPSPGEGSADAGADTRVWADAGAAAIGEDAGTSSTDGDAGVTTFAPTGNSSESYDAGTATVATSARCAADADCGVGETCNTSVGICVAATATASANVAAGLSCQADLDCASGSACVSGQCVAATEILRGCGCAVTDAATVSPMPALALLALVAISFVRLRRRYGVRPRP